MQLFSHRFTNKHVLEVKVAIMVNRRDLQVSFTYPLTRQGLRLDRLQWPLRVALIFRPRMLGRAESSLDSGGRRWKGRARGEGSLSRGGQ